MPPESVLNSIPRREVPQFRPIFSWIVDQPLKSASLTEEQKLDKTIMEAKGLAARNLRHAVRAGLDKLIATDHSPGTIAASAGQVDGFEVATSEIITNAGRFDQGRDVVGACLGKTTAGAYILCVFDTQEGMHDDGRPPAVKGDQDLSEVDEEQALLTEFINLLGEAGRGEGIVDEFSKDRGWCEPDASGAPFVPFGAEKCVWAKLDLDPVI